MSSGVLRGPEKGLGILMLTEWLWYSAYFGRRGSRRRYEVFRPSWCFSWRESSYAAVTHDADTLVVPVPLEFCFTDTPAACYEKVQV